MPAVINGVEFDDEAVDLVCTILMLKRAEIKLQAEDTLWPGSFKDSQLKDYGRLTNFVKALDPNQWTKIIDAGLDIKGQPNLKLVESVKGEDHEN